MDHNADIYWENPQDINAGKLHYSENKKWAIWEINREPQRISAMIWLENTANGEELKGKHWEYTDNNVVWHNIIQNYRSFTTSHNISL